MAAQPQPRLTPEQYLDLERSSEVRHDYYRGEMYSMDGGAVWHAALIGNLVRELGNSLKRRHCMVMASDMRVRVATDGLYTYPDVVVLCDPPQFGDNRGDTLTNPALLIEVLSPSTEAYDRGFKCAQYRTLETLREYVLVSQTEPRVEVFRRQDNGTWLLTEFLGLDTACKLGSVECQVPLAEIYYNIDFSKPNELTV